MQIKINSQIYPVEAVINACYAFIDRCYFFLDKDAQDIVVSIKSKVKLSRKQFESLNAEFMNELLCCAIRYRVSKNNKKIREYIIGRALYSVQFAAGVLAQNAVDYRKDPLGIAKTWEAGKSGK